MEGFFSDPIYGGNRNKASWKMVGYPAARGSPPDRGISQQALRRQPQSIAGFSLRERDMATRLKEVDAVMVGMGWTGSIMARELTKAGLNVVGLERGADLTPAEDFAPCRGSATS